MKSVISFLALLGAVAPLGASPAPEVKIFRDFPQGPEMAVIPPGSIMLGSTEAETTREGRTPAFAAFERPQRTIHFDRAFAVGRHHVTRAEFAIFAKATARDMAGCTIAVDGKWLDGTQPDRDYNDVGFAQTDDQPVLCVNWQDASDYAVWLSAKTGQRYRLLTEAEWEYAARAGSVTARWWGDDVASICEHANGGDRDYAARMPDDKTANLACADGYAFTSPVAHFAPNAFGLHDLYGNAWQWTADCFTPVPGDEKAPDPCPARAIRGGSWHNGASTLRSATRFSLPPAMRSSSLGFRVMREMP